MQLLTRFWPILGLIALFLAYSAINIAIDEYNEAQQEVATTKTVVVEQEKVIENAVQAGEARNSVLDRTKLTNYCQCLRTSRTAGSCERYLPNDAEDYDKPASLCSKP